MKPKEKGGKATDGKNGSKKDGGGFLFVLLEGVF